MFSWPPHGGADVDLYHTLKGLDQLGYEVHLFAAGGGTSWERGAFDAGGMPFPATRIEFDTRPFNRRNVPRRFREAIDAWRPDVVCLCDGFFLKPFVIEALAHYPLIGRYYAYEVACPRDMLLFNEGAPCPNNYLRTPDVCRRCALNALAPHIRSWRMLAWPQEFVAARAFMPGYHRLLTEALKRLNAVIVSNELMRTQLDGVAHRVYVWTGGVDAAAFVYQPRSVRNAADRKVILMPGRAVDPMKGLDVLRAAGERLSGQRRDFEIRVTRPPAEDDAPWLTSTGWLDHEAMRAAYAEADICVVPSIWEEPFGLTAVEAMAVGRPVCASRVGGLQRIIRDGETGFLFDRGDAAALAERLSRLLDDADLRQRMGRRGRAVVEAEYDWPRVIERQWPPLLDEVMR